MAQLSYAQAGVDREAADRLVSKITTMVRSTLNSKVKSSIGGYASLYAIDSKRLLAASTDGVGTKLKLAFRLGIHDTVGIDLVAMSVNDLICTGAEPLFFLDYFATGKLKKDVAEQVIKGVVDGCKQAACALVGGETAEMPDIYGEGEYDLAGFAVGMLDKDRMLPRRDIKAGDTLIGIASNGFHSNGYSLLRRLVPDGPQGDAKARELLAPTRIYVKPLMPLIRARKIKGLAHITGSGVLNIPRMSEKVSYRVQYPALKELPACFRWIRETGAVETRELYQTFNMGLGMIAAVAPKDAKGVLAKLKAAGEKAWIVGEVVKNAPGKGSRVHVLDPSENGSAKEYVIDYA